VKKRLIATGWYAKHGRFFFNFFSRRRLGEPMKLMSGKQQKIPTARRSESLLNPQSPAWLYVCLQFVFAGTAGSSADSTAGNTDDPRVADEIRARPVSAIISFFEVSIRFE